MDFLAQVTTTRQFCSGIYSTNIKHQMPGSKFSVQEIKKMDMFSIHQLLPI